MATLILHHKCMPNEPRTLLLALLTAAALSSCQPASPVATSISRPPSPIGADVTKKPITSMIVPSSTASPSRIPSSSTPSPTRLPADAFPEGSLARILAGGPECQLPCWLGIEPGRSNTDAVEDWLVSLDLINASKRVEDDNGTFISTQRANPSNLFYDDARVITLNITHDRLDFVSAADIPLPRTITDELSDVILLLGLPNQITVEPTLGSAELGYALTLLYSPPGLAIGYFGMADRVEFNGAMQDAVCLAKSPYRTISINVTPSASRLSPSQWDWPEAMGLTPTQLLNAILTQDQCLPIP